MVHGTKHLQDEVQTANGAIPAIQGRSPGRQAPHICRHALGLDDRIVLQLMPFLMGCLAEVELMASRTSTSELAQLAA